MAESPRSFGQSQESGSVDTAAGDHSPVPAWMAARRARGTTSVAESDQELEIEFESVPEAAEGSPESAKAPEVPTAVPVDIEPVSAAPKSRRVLPPLPPVPLDDVQVSRVDKSVKASVLRWIHSASMTGLVVSFIIHTTLLSAMAIVVVSRVNSDQGIVDVFGVPNGDPNGSETGEIDFDSAVLGPVDPGHDAGPLEFPDMAEIINVGAGAAGRPGDALRGVAGGEGTGSGSGGGDGNGFALPAVKIPKYAVTKGSFSVWTDPKDPVPGISYEVVIQFRLPANIKRYKGSDLSGMVVGTDDYKQRIQLGSRTFPVEDGSVQVRVRVPGANQLVRDTIRVESKLLREKQVIEIEF